MIQTRVRAVLMQRMITKVLFTDLSLKRRFNGVNTQILNTVYDSMRNRLEMAKATFSVKSEWNGGFSVTSQLQSISYW